MEGALARLQHVNVLRVEAEGGAAVVPEDACVTRHNAASPIEVDRLQHAHAVAVLVCGRDEHRITRLEDVRPRGGFSHVDALGVVVEVGFGQEPVDGNIDEVGVGDVPVPIDEGVLHCFDEQVVVISAALWDCGQIEPIKGSHDLEGGDALRRRA